MPDDLDQLILFPRERLRREWSSRRSRFLVAQALERAHLYRGDRNPGRAAHKAGPSCLFVLDLRVQQRGELGIQFLEFCLQFLAEGRLEGELDRSGIFLASRDSFFGFGDFRVQYRGERLKLPN